MTGIAPGAYVRVTRGMYAGTTGRALAIHQSAEGPYATLDVGDTHNVGVLLTALELVGAVPTAEQERDAAIAERNRLRRELEALRAAVIPLSYAADSVADALRDVAGDAHEAYLDEYRYAASRLDAILRGES